MMTTKLKISQYSLQTKLRIFLIADNFHKTFCHVPDKYSLNSPKDIGKKSYHSDYCLYVLKIMSIMY